MGNFAEWFRVLWCICLRESFCQCSEQAGPGTMVPVGCHGDGGVTPQGVSGVGGVRPKEEEKKLSHLSLFILHLSLL